MRTKQVAHAALVLMAMFPTHSVLAEGADDLKIVGNVSMVHDSNLFRLSSLADTRALLGRSSASDSYRVSSVGLNYSRAYSLQAISLNVRWTKYQYQKFDYLDFTGANYTASWRWSVTPHFYGNASATQSESLNSFVDSTDYTQRNTRTNKGRRVDATYELGANYRLIGALSNFVQTDERPLVGEGSYQTDAADIGVRYVLPYGSSFEYVLRKSDGRSTTRNLGFATAVQDFSQTDNDFSIAWAMTAVTKVGMTIGHRSRAYVNLPRADFSGPTGKLKVDWAPTSKTLFSLGATRDLQSYLTNTTNARVIDQIYSDANWSVTPKIDAAMRVQRTQESFDRQGNSLLSQRRDTIDLASASLQWSPRRYLEMRAALSNQRRKSTQPGLDYRSTAITLTAEFTY